MTSLEPATVEELVREYAPELLPGSDRGFRVFAGAAGFVMAAVMTMPVLSAIGVVGAGTPAMLMSLVFGVAGGVGCEYMARRMHGVEVRNFREKPWMLYDAVAQKFAGDVERQRARAIGPESEWGRARAGLERAAQDADRSVAYWTQRLAVESSEMAQAQLATATRLRDKFHTALSGLDERARMLVSFFNDCEARLAVLHSTRRDYEEIRKLEVLADKSHEVVANAEATLMSIGSTFVAEALRVAEALGGLERAGLTSLAGEVSVDHIEELADRIVLSAEKDRAALEQVAGAR
ncbi:MAG TPA: hypothetical protein VJR92_13320 [Gemmatimonadaceae bacterium]|nr:hypothetical protein [Gemmatimonadaceae bacterium]